MFRMFLYLTLTALIIGCNAAKENKKADIATTIALKIDKNALTLTNEVSSISAEVACSSGITKYPFTGSQITLYGSLAGCYVDLTSITLLSGEIFSGNTLNSPIFTSSIAQNPDISVQLDENDNINLEGQEGNTLNLDYTFTQIRSESKSVSNNIEISAASVSVAGELAPNYFIAGAFAYPAPTAPALKITWSCPLDECLSSIDAALVLSADLEEPISVSQLNAISTYENALSGASGSSFEFDLLSSFPSLDLANISNTEFVLVMRESGSDSSYTYFRISIVTNPANITFISSSQIIPSSLPIVRTKQELENWIDVKLSSNPSTQFEFGNFFSANNSLIHDSDINSYIQQTDGAGADTLFIDINNNDKWMSYQNASGQYGSGTWSITFLGISYADIVEISNQYDNVSISQTLSANKR